MSTAGASNSFGWYYEDSSNSLSNSFAAARTAFEEGLEIYKQNLTSDPQKRRQVDQLQASSIKDVLDAVNAAGARYKSKRTGSKVRECLTAFSRRVCHYGNIMDVMVQHHPEYVSLAWGAMKLLFGAVVEHENICTTIVVALCDVADSLPRVELAAALYPTDIMRQAIAQLYAHIVRFLIRALKWFEEGKLAHAIHSITKPASLRYADIIKEIQRETQSITNQAISSSQAEQRDMHIEISAIRNLVDTAAIRSQSEQREVQDELSNLTTMVTQLREDIALDQAVNASARIPLRNQLTEVQLNQGLSVMSSRCIIDHKYTYRASVVLRDRQKHTTRSKGTGFFIPPKLQEWNSSPDSSAVVLKTTFKERLKLRSFCTSVIEQLLEARVAVLWVLRHKREAYSLVEVLKSLIIQAMSQGCNIHTDVTFSSVLQRFLYAQSDQDYIDLFGEVIHHLRLVYVVIDGGAMSTNAAAMCQTHLYHLSRRLSEHGAQTVAKIIVSSYGPARLSVQPMVQDVLLRIGRMSPQSHRNTAKQHMHRTRGVLVISPRLG